MSAVGICRVFTAIFVMVFMISIIAYAEYELSSLAPCNDTLQYTRYILPTLILICYILLISTYTLCILIKPGRIPDEYNLTTVEIAKFMIQPNTAGHYQAITELTRQYITTRPDLQVRERDYRHGGLRICEICSIIKPDRSHHCSICQRCVIRMDHHCHWVNNCIHAGNHKYFIQTITVGVILGVLILIYCALDITCACTAIPSSGTTLYPVCVVVYLGTSIAAFVSFFLIFLTLDHCNNLFRGQTSYERVYHRDHYNRGWKQNFCTIMGSNICQWILPITPTKLTGEREPLIVTVEGTSSEVWFATTENLQTSGRGPHHSNVSIEETLSLRHEVVSPRAGGIPPNIIVNPPSSTDGSESNKNRKPSTMSK